MTTGVQTIAGIKTFSSTIVSDLNGNILDSNGNELVKGTATASAVNEITVTNAATGNGPTISASGDDANVDLNIEAKGTGVVNTSGDLTVGGAIDVTDAATTRNNLGIYTGIAIKTVGGAGTSVTVNNSNVLNTSKIMITILNDPGSTTVFYIGTIVDNTSFDIIARQGNFNITNISYLIIN